MEGEGGPDLAALTEQEKLIDRVLGINEGQRLHPAADPPEFVAVDLKGVLDLGTEAKHLKGDNRQVPAEGPDGLAQRGPFTPRGLQEAYFVFREADNIEVFICSDAALPRCLDQLIERPKSLPVTVQNKGPPFRAGEAGAGEAGRSAGEGVWFLHASAMRPRSRSRARTQKLFARRLFTRETQGEKVTGLGLRRDVFTENLSLDTPCPPH